MFDSDPKQFSWHAAGLVFQQTDSKNCYSFLQKGSRVPEVQTLMVDTKCKERKLDIRINPVWMPCTHARIVTANLGSNMSTNTDKWCLDRESLAKVLVS